MLCCAHASSLRPSATVVPSAHAQYARSHARTHTITVLCVDRSRSYKCPRERRQRRQRRQTRSARQRSAMLYYFAIKSQKNMPCARIVCYARGVFPLVVDACSQAPDGAQRAHTHTHAHMSQNMHKCRSTRSPCCWRLCTAECALLIPHHT